MTWVIIGLQVFAIVWLIVLAAGWWRLQRLIADLKRQERLRGRVGE
jgi:DNA-binding transcriptional regulator of glucitol operon